MRFKKTGKKTVSVEQGIENEYQRLRATISPSIRAMIDHEERESMIEIVQQLTGFKRSRLLKSAAKYQRQIERKAKRAFMDRQIAHLRAQIENGAEDRQEPLDYLQQEKDN